ncbi:hypothetical protein COV53_00325 [Candidatus Gottesmanbacteria bacterium CG11_big_fil_rev_8_21_14_0_20_37_11]|uniref:Glycosyltransferase family 1 protein n=2 Tax=Candidatus Gottesmaniibacteriota TaxID=1752720 RepID=A0A2M7RSM4_9BACT|nr:MAG: hypothetical protein COX23_06065 [Candidatus Gottesmanbacteria bacterium CG23_combo_of_CG06-09_8_20_14_all_37_19]PIR08939.1 MAG: hypothetical protein COV53_00325 [Candidatus Gottesmanbacteria bacterium CG11_big_fil_rev_8_21_14_0_20_37_11]PIZ03292.1 MAG: hypothetical protein COY59_00265 [Candidatus Gottesmanbacteria bacterium CG_4_10_14_0_8_um_filter_37_24]
MKIAIDISQIVYNGTGVANYTEYLVKNLIKYDHKNQYILFGFSLRKLHILKAFIRDIKKDNDNFEYKLFPIPQSILTKLWNKVHKFNLENLINNVDLIHSSDWIQPRSKAKKITTVHDLVVYKYPEFSHPKIIENQKNRLYWVKKECDMVIADSVSTRNDLISVLKFNPSKIEVVYPGLAEEFKPATIEEKNRVKYKYNLQDDYILAVGTLEPRKNIKAIINSFNKLLANQLIISRKKPIELIIVGKQGWNFQIHNSRYIRMLGYVGKQDLPALYSAASLFVYPSFYEGFGLPVLEAMSCGCPVITSNRGSLREVSGQAALFVDPDLHDDILDKMIKLIIDKDLKFNLITEGFKRSRMYNWKKAVSKMIDIYESVVRTEKYTND